VKLRCFTRSQTTSALETDIPIYVGAEIHISATPFFIKSEITQFTSPAFLQFLSFDKLPDSLR
jgi:hypothetical protein